MKRLYAMVLTLILLLASNILAESSKQDNPKKTAGSNKINNQAKAQSKQTGSANQHVIININKPTSGGHNQNYPTQQYQNQSPVQQQQKQNTAQQHQNQSPVQQQQKQNTAQQHQNQSPVQQQQKQNTAQQHQNQSPVQQQQKQNTANQSPIYGNLQLTQSNKKTGQQSHNNKQSQQPAANSAQSNTHPEVNSVNVSHHHPYEANYIRKKLQKIGVVTAPGYIINREEVINTDRDHSKIAYPKEDFDKHSLNASAFSPRHFNDNIVKTQMSLVNNSQWQENIHSFNQTETQANHYYWHKDKNFNYCHYIDNSGYHWYGWYLGNKYFWTRNFNNRWWWYDEDYDRWCFWNGGFWWWQDPYHLGDLYCYNDADYIPCNSANDNVAVTVPDNINTQNFTSPDNTRIVKVVSDTQDAFLYDTSNPSAFNPIYLASGVQDVMYSKPNNGKPLEIILKLNDGSFDMFDSNGNPYNLGATEGN